MDRAGREKIEEIESIDTINALAEQIEAILDLLNTMDDKGLTDIKSIKCASEMAMTMFLELMTQVEKLVEPEEQKEN